MRIVAGHAKGRRLAAPAGGTRPTSDRAREGLFSSLAALTDLDGAHVLDLYAGTGAVGLEALSRGAREAVFVESDRAAVAVLRRNIATVGLDGATVVPAAVEAYLARGSDEGAEFTVAFADPPYELSDDALASVLAALVAPTAGARLAEGGIVAVERSARGAAPRWPDAIEALRHRRYGEGVLWYGRRR